MLVYLDSSAIVKRYVEETGSESVDILYNMLEEESETRKDEDTTTADVFGLEFGGSHWCNRHKAPER